MVSVYPSRPRQPRSGMG